MPYRYPRWANETEHVADGVRRTAMFFPWDRLRAARAVQRFRAGTGTTSHWKALVYRMPPEGHGPGSRWAGFVEWLWERYADRIAGVRGRQRAQRPAVAAAHDRSTRTTSTPAGAPTGTTLVARRRVAEMMTTVDAIARRHPAAAAARAVDVGHDQQHRPALPRRSRTPTSTRRVLRPVRGSRCSPSSTGGIRRRTTAGSGRSTTTPTSSAATTTPDTCANSSHERGWRGRQLDGGPEMWCTEGGCRLAAMNTRFRPTPGARTDHESRKSTSRRACSPRRSSRHHFAKGAGAGIGMVTQYTTYADPASTAASSTPRATAAPRDPRSRRGAPCPSSTPRRSSAPPGARSSKPAGAPPAGRGVSGCRAWRRHGRARSRPS